MKIIIILLTFIKMISNCNAQSNNLFYYSFDKKIYLTHIPNKYVAEFITEKDSTFFSSRNVLSKKINEKTFKVCGDFNTLKTIGNGEFSLNPLLKNSLGTNYKILNQIVLRWKQNISQNQKAVLISQYNLSEIKSTRLFTIFKVENPLFISQFIYESGLVRYCHPVFIVDVFNLSLPKEENHAVNSPINKKTIPKKLQEAPVLPQYIPNDEYFSHQWNLHNIGQECNDGNFGTIDADIDAPEAWVITKGNPDIVVAIHDYGVTDNHFDLPSNRQLRLPGSNFVLGNINNNPNDPSPINSLRSNHHGNACAGIVAAENNNEGIIGIAPQCKIMPLRAFTGNLETMAEAITFAVDNNVNIISASWGTYADPYSNATIITAIEDAIQNNVSVVFSAGNDANHSQYLVGNHPGSSFNDGNVSFPANAIIPNLITVGASNRYDLQSNYSPSNEKIDIVAPSNLDFSIIPNEKLDIWTLDLPSDYGMNDYPTGVFLPASGINSNHYKDITGRFGGTSAATPEVAGVAALMLSINPCLSVSQITNVLYNTTDKVGGYNYSWNDSKPGHSKEMGYGRLNAYNSVHIAQEMQSNTLDLQIKDTPNDFGIQPNTVSTYFWNSNDIWIRNLQDGVEEHQNPEFNPTNPPYVYVRVTNKSCVPSIGNEILKTYWAKAGTGLTWPSSWDNSGTFSNGSSMGKPIGQIQIPIISPGQSIVLSIPWSNMPNHLDYDFLNEEKWHFCLLSRIETTNDPMASIETSDLVSNVANNNNIAWKNVTVVDFIPNLVGGAIADGGVISIQNPFDEIKEFSLELVKEEFETGKSVYEEAEVSIKMDNNLYNAWVRGGKESQFLENTLDEKKRIVTNNHVIIDNIRFNPREIGTAYLRFNFLTKELSEKTKFTYHVIQRDKSNGKIIGGETYIIRKKPRTVFLADAGTDKDFDKNQPITISAEQINEAAIYNWYDSEGVLIYTGKDLTISSDISKKYKLEVVATLDGFKDYDEIEIKLKPSIIESTSPNPASNNVLVKYKTNGISSAYLMIMGYYVGSSQTSNNYILNIDATETNINIANYPNGFYTIALVCDGQILDAKPLIKQ